MDALAIHRVSLPDDTFASVSSVPEDWWSVPNGSGFVDPKMLAPDPNQPRKMMTESRLRELQESVASKGVRESIAVTPRHHTPWAAVAKEHDHCYFIIVSGHRRVQAAIRSGIGAVPVKVVIYKNEADHREDAALLNANREDINEIEEGETFVYLRSLGRTIEQLATTFGKEAVQVYGRINLTKLHHDIQEMVLNRDGRRRRQLSVTAAEILGGVKAPTAEELEHLFERFSEYVTMEEIIRKRKPSDLVEQECRFAMQKIIVAVIKKRNLTATRAVELIREQTLTFLAHRGSQQHKRAERFRPGRRIDILETMVKDLQTSVVIDWSSQEFFRIFENRSREDVDDFLNRLIQAKEQLTKIENIVLGIRNSKRATSPEVLRIIEKTRKVH
jgi:ParB/RepB/Spo0J family partition protein